MKKTTPDDSEIREILARLFVWGAVGFTLGIIIEWAKGPGYQIPLLWILIYAVCIIGGVPIFYRRFPSMMRAFFSFWDKVFLVFRKALKLLKGKR